jgi:hypothetical protein
MFSAAQAACTCSAHFASTRYRLLDTVHKIFVKSLHRYRRGLQIEHGSAGIPPHQTDACNRAPLIISSVAASQVMAVSGIGWSILACSKPPVLLSQAMLRNSLVREDHLVTDCAISTSTGELPVAFIVSVDASSRVPDRCGCTVQGTSAANA